MPIISELRAPGPRPSPRLPWTNTLVYKARNSIEVDEQLK